MKSKSKELIINRNIKNIYGFLILTNSNVLIGTISKNKKEINYENKVDFRKIRTRGGASALRFAGVFRERIARSVRLIDDNIENIFIKENELNISGLIIAGNMDTINKYLSSIFHKDYLNKYICSKIEIDYGGEWGLNQAIELSMINC